jgi:hypothetical protein
MSQLTYWDFFFLYLWFLFPKCTQITVGNIQTSTSLFCAQDEQSKWQKCAFTSTKHGFQVICASQNADSAHIACGPCSTIVVSEL